MFFGIGRQSGEQRLLDYKELLQQVTVQQRLKNTDLTGAKNCLFNI